MKHLHELATIVLAALSLLAAIAAGIAWGRSYWVADSFVWHDGFDHSESALHLGYQGPVFYLSEYLIVSSDGGMRFSYEDWKYSGDLAGYWDAGHYFRHDRAKPDAYPYFPSSFGKPTMDARIMGFQLLISVWI